MNETALQEQMRAHYERMHGPGSWEKMRERNRQREEESRRWEEERQRLMAEREAQIQWQKEHKEELRRRQYLYTHSMEVFLKEKEGICFDRSGTITSQELYDIYDRWCTKQDIFPEAPRIFWGWLKESGAEYCIRPCQNLPTPDGRRVRGFRGIRPAPEETHSTE